MPADKKSFLDLKFHDFSVDTRNALKKLTLTELSKLADDVERLREFQAGGNYREG